MKIGEITDFLEGWAHPALQEAYDNSGLILGDKNDECHSALITLDVTEEVIDEAVENDINLIIAHHPIIFKGIKRIGKNHWIDKCLRKAISHDIAIYSIHTNLDNVSTGVNKKICEKIGLGDLQVLQPKANMLTKLTLFVPKENKDELLSALFQSGAGNIGNYDECSFESAGTGSFRGNESSNPTIGKKGIREYVSESRIEVLVEKHNLGRVLSAMKAAHPYEEVAYYASDLLNENQEIGSGMIGSLDREMSAVDFLTMLKSSMQLNMVRHTRLTNEPVKKVAVCGGSGSFLLKKAIGKRADVFVTADFKYHEFFEANDQIMIADIGHYESEVFTKDLLHDELTKTFANFAFRLSKVDTNPINYL